MPREFFVPKSSADLWVTYPVPPNVRGRYLRSIARLAPGVTVGEATEPAAGSPPPAPEP